MVVVGRAFMDRVVQMGGLHWETNIHHMLPPQLNTMAAGLTTVVLLLHILTASALESTSEQGMFMNLYLLTILFSLLVLHK